MSNRLLPYDTIIKAHEGDPIAIQAVLDRYAGYIRYFSNMNGYYNSDMEDYIRTKLIEAEAVLHSDESIEESYLQKELISEVNRIIETLPEKIRIPLTLFYLSNCSVEQISTIIKKPPGTVKSRLFKGRSLIKKRLEEAGYEK